MFEMHESALDVVDLERAADAALLPAGAKHKMLDDQLAATVEEVSQHLRAVGSLEEVGLVDLDPRQFAAFGAQSVAQAGEFLFLRQMRLAGGQPLVSGNDPIVHLHSISSDCNLSIANFLCFA